MKSGWTALAWRVDMGKGRKGQNMARMAWQKQAWWRKKTQHKRWRLYAKKKKPYPFFQDRQAKQKQASNRRRRRQAAHCSACLIHFFLHVFSDKHFHGPPPACPTPAIILINFPMHYLHTPPLGSDRPSISVWWAAFILCMLQMNMGLQTLCVSLVVTDRQFDIGHFMCC